jgi:hypothetical protein
MFNQHDDKVMQNDYLWDATGEPDPEIQRLEQALARFRHTGPTRPTPAFPALETLAQPLSWWQQLGLSFQATRLAAATVLIAAVAGGLWFASSLRPPAAATDSWQVQIMAALPESAGTSAARQSWLEVGGTLETNTDSQASITVGEIGRLDVEPLTRLRLLQSAAGHKRIALDHGTIHAAIWAPPGQFVVDTPSAIAVDMGCMYTLHVDESGSGILRTTLGWVGFRRDGRESFIPAGAACATHAKSGPGTPYFEDASDAFRAALSQLDSAGLSPTARQDALTTVLKQARPRDALTLWHLLSRVDDIQRPAVYDRLAALAPPPYGVTRNGVLQLDRTMLDEWWDAFDLGSIGLWRHWEQNWTGREGQRP